MSTTIDDIQQQIRTAIQSDDRFKKKSDSGSLLYPYCCDIEQDDGEDWCAIICCGDGAMVKVPFTVEDGEVTLGDEMTPTERKTIYSKEHVCFNGVPVVKATKPKTMKKTASEILYAHHSAAGPILAKWKQGQETELMWMPAGVSTITAGFRDGAINVTVECDETTAETVQASFEQWLSERPKQKPFGCVEHREQEASVHPTRFSFKGGEEDGGVYMAAEPTKLGADNVNGKVHRSWSPAFTTDADYSKAREKNGTLYFSDNARGGKNNPASITGVDFCVGTLTNKPAFVNMSPIKAREAIKAAGNSDGASAGHASRKTAVADDASVEAHKASVEAHEGGTDEQHQAAAVAHKTASEAHTNAMVAHAKAGNKDEASFHSDMAHAHDATASAHDCGEEAVTATGQVNGQTVVVRAGGPGSGPHKGVADKLSKSADQQSDEAKDASASVAMKDAHGTMGNKATVSDHLRAASEHAEASALHNAAAAEHDKEGNVGAAKTEREYEKFHDDAYNGHIEAADKLGKLKGVQKKISSSVLSSKPPPTSASAILAQRAGTAKPGALEILNKRN
jgi:hypothetical protein